jgi:hypothetical protein
MDDWPDDATVPSFGPRAVADAVSWARRLCRIGSNRPTDCRVAPGGDVAAHRLGLCLPAFPVRNAAAMAEPLTRPRPLARSTQRAGALHRCLLYSEQAAAAGVRRDSVRTAQTAHAAPALASRFPQGRGLNDQIQSGPCCVWITVRNPASIAVQRERSEIWNR